jgi:ATP-dependent RNA helicase DHX57
MLCMQGIDAGRRQYADILADLGFVPPGYAVQAGRGGAGASRAQQQQRYSHDVDQYSGNARVVKAALCAGFYPQAR